MSNADPLTKALQRLVAAAGGDARALRVPQCRAPVQVRVQQIGAARIVVVEPRPGPAWAALLAAAGRVLAARQASHTHLRGVVVSSQGELWLCVPDHAGWTVPLLPGSPTVQAAITQQVTHTVTLSGVIMDAGFYVSQVLTPAQQ